MKTSAWALSDALSVAERTMTLTESPIEARMLNALLTNQRHTEADLHLTGRGIVAGDYRVFFVDLDDVTALLVPQLKVTRFRLDIAVILQRGDRRVYAVIECDGQQFHSHPDDVKRDKVRDRELAQAGWMVSRFPGSEIVAGDSTRSQLIWSYLTALARVWCRDDREFSIAIPESFRE
jgi:hypothetical protein